MLGSEHENWQENDKTEIVEADTQTNTGVSWISLNPPSQEAAKQSNSSLV